MKYMFVSDIHGNLEILEKIIVIFENENADKLVLLGDTSGGYYDNSNFFMAEILNNMKNKVEIIRGNCDSEEFEDMLEFEMFNDDILFIPRESTDKKDVFLAYENDNKALKEYITVSISHGHIYDFQYLPPNCGEIFVQGHTHIPQLFKSGDRIFANPGSPTRPRGTDLRCYITIDSTKIQLKSFEGSVINEIMLPN